MSYTSPKYTYVSQQPAFDKLQKDIVGAAADIAKKKQDHIDAERKKGEEIDALGRSASQSYIIDKAGYNDVGNQVTKGAVGELFAGTGKRVGEITRLTSGANPQCKIDGNCNELYEELAALNTIVHPAVREEMTNRRQAFVETDNTVILEIPLLVESGYRNFDAIVVVDVDTDTAVKRLVKYRSFGEEDARNRLERQVSRESRTEIADYVIDNNNSMGEFNNEILKCWEWIKSIERPEIGRDLPPLISKE